MKPGFMARNAGTGRGLILLRSTTPAEPPGTLSFEWPGPSNVAADILDGHVVNPRAPISVSLAARHALRIATICMQARYMGLRSLPCAPAQVLPMRIGARITYAASASTTPHLPSA